MSMWIEVTIKVPGVPAQRGVEERTSITTLQTRFTKRMEFESVPKVGESLEVRIRPDVVYHSIVKHVEWSEGKDLFVVFCDCKKNRGTAAADYLALLNDSEWSRRELA